MKSYINAYLKKLYVILLMVIIMCLFASLAFAERPSFTADGNRGADSTSTRVSSVQGVQGNSAISYTSTQDSVRIRNNSTGSKGSANPNPIDERSFTDTTGNRNSGNSDSSVSNPSRSYSNSDYAKLYERTVKIDNYFQKDYSKKAVFSKKVGDLYRDWVLEKQFLEATGKTDEMSMLNAEMEAELAVMKTENKINDYGLEELFSADMTSSNTDLVSAWQKARAISTNYENASAEKGTQAAVDTYWKNYYTKEAKKDADNKADAAAKAAAFNKYLAARGLR